MINPRSIATLGIGFGVAALATLGVVADTQPQPQPVTAYVGGAYPTLPSPLPPRPSLNHSEEEELLLLLLSL